MPLLDSLPAGNWTAAHWHIVALAAIVLACAFREHGQGHDWLGTTWACVLFWALPVGAVVYVLSPPYPLGGAWTAALVGTMAVLGLMLPHGVGQNLTEAPADYPASWTAGLPLSEKLG